MSFTVGLESPRYVQHCPEKPSRKQRGREITMALLCLVLEPVQNNWVGLQL